jgi:hypothetical protein
LLDGNREGFLKTMFMNEQQKTMEVVKSASSNGHKQGVEPTEPTSVRDTASSTAPRRREQMKGVGLSVQSGLEEDGRQFALASGATAPRQEDLTVIRERADAVACDAFRPTYDPKQYAHDKVIEDEYQKLLHDREDEELGLKHSHTVLAERKNEAAKAQAQVPPVPAEPPFLLRAAAVVALAATIAPAAHDFLWVMDNEPISWSLSLITGLVFGILIALLILADNHDNERRSLTNWTGLTGGVGIGIALFLLRVKGTDDSEQVLFGLATSILEIAIVVFLESLATSHRSAQRRRLPLEATAKEAEGSAAVQEGEVARRKAGVDEINLQIDEHAAYVEERHLRATNLKEIREAARKAAEAGYLKGISENRGKLIGVQS